MNTLLGFDNNGKVKDCGKYIKRNISKNYINKLDKIIEIYSFHKLDLEGIVKTKQANKTTLIHKKYIISYPYEWTASMIKDALLFHLTLIQTLEDYGMTLKDALPNNILFNDTQPVFIDFLSLVFIDSLKEEDWLNIQGNCDARFAVTDTMLLTYFVYPLLALHNNKYELAREMLGEKSCNCTNNTVRLRSVLAVKDIKRLIESTLYATRLKFYRYIFRNNFNIYINKIISTIKNLTVAPEKSAYAHYYSEKNEELSYTDKTHWNSKQLSVFDILENSKPKTVLDIGANTGWFSILAEKLGSSVISLDIDESSIDLLYLKAKKEKLRILPLKVSFSELTKEVYSIYNSTIPLYMKATNRLKCDTVIALGITHHLTLGEGHCFSYVFDILARLTIEELIVEFIDLSDELIVNNPSFFQNLNKFNSNNYNIDKFVSAGTQHFSDYTILDSYPRSRKILLFTR